MSSFRGRYSSHSGSSYSQGLISPPCSSPYGSPRHSYARSPRKGASSSDRAILTVQAVLLMLFLLAIWKGISYSTRDIRSEYPDSACTECKAQADMPISDLSIKLASNKPASRGRKDFYEGDIGVSRGSRDGQSAYDYVSDINAGTLAAADQQQSQQKYNSEVENHSKYPYSDSQGVQRQRPQPPQLPLHHTPQQKTLQAEQQAAGSTVAQQVQPGNLEGTHAPAPAAGSTSAAPAAPAAGTQLAGTGSSSTTDPLHESPRKTDKEAEQLAALSRIVQQQQDTISRQSKALLDLQQRFLQQEHQLQAATASAATSNTTDGVEVENYLPQERVKQELDMLHNVEAQIEALSAGVTIASKALPQLSDQQKASQLADLARAEQYMSRLSRVAAAISLRTSDPLTEGAHDPIMELRHYYATVASSNVTLSWEDALSRQARPTAESQGIVHVEPYADEEADLDTLDLRLEYAQAVLTQMHAETPCKLGLVTTWSGDLWGLRRELLPWLTYHALQGVSKIYVMYEGGDKNTLTSLHDLAPNVRVMLSSPPLASSTDVAAFDAWLHSVPDSHIKDWSSQPGNYQLMIKQGYAVTRALELARADNITWLIHMDPDELLHPGAGPSAGNAGTAFSLLPELCGAPAHIPSIRFVNIEGVPEAADIENRYQEVTLFRAHRHLVPPAAQPFRYIFKQGHAESWLHLYTNGKSAVRPDAPGVVQGGPHVFLGPADPRWVTPDNPHGIWRPVVSNSTLVLHYAYATPGDVAVKAGRSCPEEVVEAALAGNTGAVSKCFVLDLDQRAYVAALKDRRAAGLPLPKPPAASSEPSPAEQRAARAGFTGRTLLVDDATLAGIKTSNEFSNASWPVGKEVLKFFWGELALSEGAPFECLTPDGKAKGWCPMSDVSKLKSHLISTGLMMRLHAPAQALKGIEAAVRQLMMISGRTAHPVHPSAARAKAVDDKATSGTAAAADVSDEKQQLGRQVEAAAVRVADAQQTTDAKPSGAAIDSVTSISNSASTGVPAGKAIPEKVAQAPEASVADSATAGILAHTDNALLGSNDSSSLGAAAATRQPDSNSNASTGAGTLTAGSPATAFVPEEEPFMWDGATLDQDSHHQMSDHDDHAKHGHRSALRDKLLIA